MIEIIIDYWTFWVLGFMAVMVLIIILVGNLKNMNKDMINDLIDNKLDQYQPYPQINISLGDEETGAPINLEYPYIITGTCNKIDYISQRFRWRPTPFQIDRFRHHCIFEYEKSGKSKVIDYADCDGYEELSFSNDK